MSLFTLLTEKRFKVHARKFDYRCSEKESDRLAKWLDISHVTMWKEHSFGMLSRLSALLIQFDEKNYFFSRRVGLERSAHFVCIGKITDRIESVPSLEGFLLSMKQSTFEKSV